MVSGFFTILKSYFTDVLIESASSVFNPNLELYLVDGRYQLCANDAIYSFDDKYANFAEAFDKTKWSDFQVKNALILGLGLASIPYILEKKHKINLDYTAVEIDDAVIYLASKYRIPKLKSTVQIVHTDASIFMEQCSDQYDMVCMDVFIDQDIPDEFITESSIQRLYDVLKPGGLLYYNILEKGHEQTCEFICEKLAERFEHSELIHVENNVVVKAIK